MSGCTWIPTMVNQSVDLGTTIAEDRSFYNIANDYTIRGDIQSALFDETLLVDVSTDVYEGRVMLTGSVEKPEDRQRAEELARRGQAAREILNEVQVTPEGRFKAFINDLFIQSKVKTNLLVTEMLRSLNYRVRSVNGVVYLIGSVRDREELERVIALARSTNGVRDVVSHIRLKSEPVLVKADPVLAKAEAVITKPEPVLAKAEPVPAKACCKKGAKVKSPAPKAKVPLAPTPASPPVQVAQQPAVASPLNTR